MLNVDPWDTLLQTYVDNQGQVDYGRWQLEAADALNAWLGSMTSISLGALSSEEQLALLLNLYNALVIQQVLRRYPIRSIRPKRIGIPNWLSFLRFFSRPIYVLDGQSLSLNTIEHQILRPQFKEPRIHFALVCAALGCPLLRSEAYYPTIVEAQLDTDAQRFIHNPDKVRYDPQMEVLYCSQIFKWYQADFLQAADSIPAYVSQYLPLVPHTATVQYLPYDWGLNQRTSS
ncbi:DUF547 domain-containing protein [Nodosilinea sp. P-1105]|uniref:DUF547 domain-containing protein n=1 Tax=Nodosilinea sp. P-1105 TaxID=2546229 RepID=UPI00146E2AC8|nr:DUF547 domain-containing protein [Nodosilinea sp. P-1105]NMF83210.1 DUF547 domain-containing protein [Nodosilinea sp. P-1105]